ncbi:MAG: rhodanese-like domain-containing protein [Verrucomicrobia bacterium]|nr:rhodanese-like domain-containing protein [Verrucomicrobiota bacterium]
MKNTTRFLIALIATGPLIAAEKNPHIDYETFARQVGEVGKYREAHRLAEPDFIAAMAEPGVVILDARSADKYEMTHIKGAVNLPITDFTGQTLAAHIPDKKTKVLIYCNNNFEGDPRAMPMKRAPASLNIMTMVNLHTYGYKNVFELAPYQQIEKSKIPLVRK